jgi:hypothetical protein
MLHPYHIMDAAHLNGAGHREIIWQDIQDQYAGNADDQERNSF